MVCERCGKEIYNPGRRFCPACGSAITTQQANYRQSQPEAGHINTTAYQRGYRDQHRTSWQQADKNNAWDPMSHSKQDYSGYSVPPQYQAPYTSTPYAPPLQPAYMASTKNDGALIAEFILSLFGIFGVGWLVGKETRIGTILLLASIFIYWPLMILGTVSTFGLGLICLGPLAIATVIVNILLLNQRLKKKAMHFVITPTPSGMQPQSPSAPPIHPVPPMPPIHP